MEVESSLDLPWFPFSLIAIVHASDRVLSGWRDMISRRRIGMNFAFQHVRCEVSFFPSFFRALKTAFYVFESFSPFSCLAKTRNNKRKAENGKLSDKLEITFPAPS